MFKLTDEQREVIQDQLNACAWFNGGRGLMIEESRAEHYRENGITGPFFVAPKLPRFGTHG